MTKKNWVNLHSHDIHSLLDGYGRPEVYAERAIELGQPALATTNHGNLFGIYKHYETCMDMGIKPILGIEAYVARKTRFDDDAEEKSGPATSEWGQRGPYHMTILTKDNNGYSNLIKLSSTAYTQGFVGKPRMDNDLLSQYSEGLIFGSGCLSGAVQQALLRGDFDQALKEAATLQEIVGKENFFIEVMYHGIEEEKQVLEDLFRIAKKLDAKIVPTNDTHYVHKEDHDNHDTMLCVGVGALKNKEDRFKFSGPEFYLKSYDEMLELFPAEYLENTMHFSEMCDVNLSFGDFFFPSFPDVPAGMTADEFFVKEAWDGMRRRFGDNISDEYKERAEYEIEVIRKMGFQEYFLVTADLVMAAKGGGVHLGPGRGSAASSLISYAMGITNLDPIHFNLIFERFLNVDRVSMPDIDLDTDDRQWMINYAKEKYGAERVAQIATFARVKPKSAIRDATRVLGFEHSEGDRIAKLVPPAVLGVDKTMDQALASPELLKEYNENKDSKLILDSAAGLEGLLRQPGIHAAGVVIAQSDVSDFCPVMIPSPKKKDQIVTQVDMKRVEELGLLKMDFLGLRNLWVIADCIQKVKDRRGIHIVEDEVPWDDQKTYEMLQQGHSIGVFQVEGSGMRKMMIDLRPETIYDVMALIALYRPGPMGSGMHHTYIQRKRGKAAPEPPHPILEKDLERSLGIMLYQEDVIKVISKLAGWSPSEGDSLRKCLPKGSLIPTYRNGYQKIEKLMSLKDKRVQTIDTKTYCSINEEVSDVWSVGEKDIYKLTTTSGREISATLNHQFLIDEEWTDLSDIKVGDAIAVAKKITTQGGSRISASEATLVAYLISEGHLPSTSSGGYFCNTDEEILREYENAFYDVFKESPPPRRTNKDGVSYIYLHKDKKDKILSFLGSLGLSKDKVISTSVTNASYVVVRRFLAAYLNADGWIDNFGIHYCSASKNICMGLKRMFLRMGVIATVYSKHNTKYNRDYWCLSICQAEDVDKAYKELHSGLTTKRSEQYNKRASRVCGRSGGFGVPSTLVRKELDRRCKMLNKSKRELGIDSGGYFNSSLISSIVATSRIYSEKLNDIHHGDLTWERVKSIEYQGKVECFDFSMKNQDRPYAVVEDFLVHNCIGKKLQDEIANYRPKFVEGCKKTNGIDANLANKIFSDIEYFAGYGFSLAHAASYALISYMTAYLKANYPEEYMASLLTSCSEEAPEKLALYLRECRRMGITVLQPSVSESSNDFSVVSDGVIRFGLNCIKGIGASMAERLSAGKRKFEGVHDFLRSVDADLLNTGVIQKLVTGGALDDLVDTSGIKLSMSEKRQYLTEEKGVLSVYLSSHPLEDVMHVLDPMIDCNIEKLFKYSDGRWMKLGGIITSVTKKRTKAGRNMYILELEDLTGTIEVLVFPQLFDKWEDRFSIGEIVVMEGRLNKDLPMDADPNDDTVEPMNTLYFQDMIIPDLPTSAGKPVIYTCPNKPTYDMIKVMNELIEHNPGDSEVFMNFNEGDKVIHLKFSDTADYGILEDFKKIGLNA